METSNIFKWLFGVLSLLVVFGPSFNSKACAAETPEAILKKADDARAPQVPFSTTVHVSDIQNGETQSSVYRVKVKGIRFSLVEQTEPARSQGRKLLMRDRDLWLFTPNISRPTRISFEQKLSGEVANGDLMRTNFSEDYSGQITGEEKLGTIAAVKLRLTAKYKEVTYRSIDYWVDKATHYPVKAIFYAISGRPLKIAEYSNFKPVLGAPRMTTVLITDALQSKHYSKLEYSGYKKENFDDTFFSKETLGE